MATKPDVYELVLKEAGLTVHVSVLTVSQLLMAMRSAEVATASSRLSEGVAINAESLRMSLRSINGERVQYKDLQGQDLIRKLGRVRYFSAIADATGGWYAADVDDLEDMKRKASIRIDDFAEIWTVALPDGRKVEIEEVDLVTLGKAMEDAEGKARKSVGAAVLLNAIASVKRSIRSIDGVAINAEALEGKNWDKTFTVKESRILGWMYDQIHAGAGDFVVGEAKPTTGTK